jgi:hypothetical protein
MGPAWLVFAMRAQGNWQIHCRLPVAILQGQRSMSKLDQFAEYLAEGKSVPEASRLVGIYSGYGNALLQRIRKRLGPQAR